MADRKKQEVPRGKKQEEEEVAARGKKHDLQQGTEETVSQKKPCLDREHVSTRC